MRDSLEDVLSRELHLARLQQQGASAADIGAEVGAGAVGLEGIGRVARRSRIEPIGVQDIENLDGKAKLLLAEGVE